MKLVTYDTLTNCILTIDECKLVSSALRSHNEKHEIERTMTRQLKREILEMLNPIEHRIESLEEIYPELPQSIYDEFQELEKLHILQNIPDEN